MDACYAIIPVTKFKQAKTRLSPFLSGKEREKLLKVMLHDVTDALKDHVDKIFIISRDRDVLTYAKSLKLNTILENDNSNLNKALTQAMEYCKGKSEKIMIVPSDIPLIGKTNLEMLINSSKDTDFIIVPSKGGGTNMIIMKPMIISTHFEGFSFQKHLKTAFENKLSVQVHDSFFIALDVNTTEDLGEIMIHGNDTHTKEYLKEELKVNFEPFRSSERIKVTRND